LAKVQDAGVTWGGLCCRSCRHSCCFSLCGLYFMSVADCVNVLCIVCI